MRSAAKLFSQLPAAAADRVPITATCHKAALSAGCHYYGTAASGGTETAQSLRSLFTSSDVLLRSAAPGLTRGALRIAFGNEASKLQRASAVVRTLADRTAKEVGSCQAPLSVAVRRLCQCPSFQAQPPAAAAAVTGAAAAAAFRWRPASTAARRVSAMATSMLHRPLWAAAARSICTGSRVASTGSRVFSPAAVGRPATACQAGAQSARLASQCWSRATAGGGYAVSGCSCLAAARVARSVTQRQGSTAPVAVILRRAFATWSDVSPRGWNQHGGFRVLQSRGANVDPMTVVYTLMGASNR